MNLETLDVLLRSHLRVDMYGVVRGSRSPGVRSRVYRCVWLLV